MNGPREGGTDDRRQATRTSGNQRPAALLIPALADFEDEVRRRARRLPGEKTVAPDATDLGHGALGTPVFLAHPEDDGVDETKGMIEHQAFDFAIGRSAPMAAHEKRPANLDLAEFGVIAVIAARAEQPAGPAGDEYEGHFRGDPALEIRPEFRLGGAG